MSATLPQRVGPIFALGAPLVGFFMIYTAVNIATVGMLGRLGDAAIAGVGVGAAVYGAICALLYGVDTGVQAIVSRATGAGRAERIAAVLAAAHAGAIPLALVVGTATWALGPGLVALILPDHAAAAIGAGWIRLAAPSMVFLAVTLPINAAWIGSGRPAIATAVTAALAPLQIALTFLFVLGVGPVRGFGAIGGALALDAAMLAGAVLQVGLALWLIPGFLRVRPRGAVEIAAIGWPISAQQSLLQVALMGVFAVIAQLGAAPAAIANVLLTLTSVPTQTGTGLGVAAATLVGQALGRRDTHEARAWGWRTTTVTVAVTAPMGLLLALAPQALLVPFLRDPATLAMAILPARIVGFGVAINTASIVLGFAFRGAGATKIAALVPFVSIWFVQLPLMTWIGLGLRQGLAGMVAVLTGVTTADVVVLAALWAGASWSRVRIGAATAPSELPSNLRRIAILGGGGAGKSTLARQLGEALGLPVIHLDRLAFGPGWTRRAAEALQADLVRPLEGGAWIVDGTYAEASALTLPAADLVLWLDQPAWRRLFRSWRKTVSHRHCPRSDRPDGCEERFGWRYARMVLSFGAWSPGLAARLEAMAGGPVVRLRGDAALRRLLDYVAAHADRCSEFNRLSAELKLPAPSLQAESGPSTRDLAASLASLH